MLTKISNYSISNQDASALMVTEDTQRIGLMRFIMLNQFNAAPPGMMLGSIVEVNGALFRNVTADEVCTYHDATGNEYPAADAPDGLLYIVMIPDDDTCKCVLKTLATTGKYFDNVRCGYYETATQNRVIGSCVKSGSSFTYKKLYHFNDPVADDKIQVSSEGAYIKGYMDGYAGGDTDNKLILSTSHGCGSAEQVGYQEITHPCDGRISTVISVSGNDGHIYRYTYRLVFRPTANVGATPIYVTGTLITSYETNKTVTINNYASKALMPGTYYITHQFISRESSYMGGYNNTQTFWQDARGGSMTMASTLFVGNVWGHISGKIL